MNPIQKDDFFDCLPDEIVLSIFNKLQDAKTLCLSMSVCKRFHSIVPQVNEITLHIPPKKTRLKHQEIQKGFFKTFVNKALLKPLQFFSQIIKSKSKNHDAEINYFHVPNNVLKPFDEIRSLNLKLPCHGFEKQGNNSEKTTTFLKWKAEFGKELQSCVMLGAKSVTENFENEAKVSESRVIGNDELKLRIVWTISCLIAASARHHLIQDTIRYQKMVEKLIVCDESDQGRVCMNKEQIGELRGIIKTEKDDVNSAIFEYRSKVPTLRMKMWYLERLELPDSGKVMEGATLVVIKPVAGDIGEMKGWTDAVLVDSVFGVEGEGKMVEEAVRKLMVAKKCYTLEMNAF